MTYNGVSSDLSHHYNHIGGVMVSVHASVKPKTIKLVFVASPLSTQL
jgi:hypothetical protein